MIFAGTIGDIDLISARYGAAAYFAARRTYTDSIVGMVAVIVLAVLLTRVLAWKRGETIASLIVPIALAGIVHVALDLFQSEGVALLWPWQARRFAMDWLPAVDPWILAILIAGIFVPELLRLVSSEIGAKHRAPRGRNGGMFALVTMALYIAARGTLHMASMVTLEPHLYHGESPRGFGAFADTLSIATWHGVVETRSFVCLTDVPVGPGRTFDPESADCLHKPEQSEELDAAQKSRVAQEYLRAAPFPRAIVDKTQNGYEVVIRSMRDLAENETQHRVAAVIFLDASNTITSQELVWVRELHLR